MIFGRKIGNKSTQQMKEMMEKVLTDALQRQEQTSQLNEMMEKNQKAVRRLSDTVEDFLDTLQEENEERRQSQQKHAEAAERERRMLELLGLYQEQMELFEQWITGQSQENSEEATEAWRLQYAMLKRKIAEGSRFCAIESTGVEGELVDYRLHEVLQALEPDTEEQEGTVAKVCSHGMLYQGNVIRKARVTVYRKS